MKLFVFTNTRGKEGYDQRYLNDNDYDYDVIFSNTMNREKYRIIELLNSNKIGTIDKLKLIDNIQEKSYAINLQPDNLFFNEWNFHFE
jgi:hypothetical protein